MVLSLYDLEHEDIRMILLHEVLAHLVVGKEGNICKILSQRYE